MKAPTVNFSLFGEEWLITDYIQVSNPQLRRIARKIKGKNRDEIILKVVEWVAENIEYPLDYRGRPNAAQYAKKFKWFDGVYLAETPDELRRYGWLFPNQTATIGKGICFDSACLCTTLLRIKQIPAWTVLGAVLRTKSKRFLGLHAWTETIMENGTPVVIETTVHPHPPELIKTSQIYNGRLPITYDPFAWFNESEWKEDKEKVALYEGMILGKQ